MQFRPSIRLLSSSTVLIGLCLVGTSCLPWGFGTTNSSSFVQKEDVMLEVPGADEVMTRAASADPIRGDVHVLAVVTANDVNAWVTTMVEGAAAVVSYLQNQPATSREGTVQIYGPYDDNDGRNLSWLVRLEGNITSSNYELWVGARGSKSQDDMKQLMTGDLLVESNIRSGGFSLDFDVVEEFSEMKSFDGALWTYSGKLEVTFERDTLSLKKHIDIDFDNYEALYTGFLDDDAFSTDKTYVYHREDDGAGEFHLALMGEWDEANWSGPEKEEMILDMAWTPDESGRARGQILEVLEGDLKYGDLVVHECFDPDGYLTWRQITEEYLVEDPDYNFGDETSCVLGADVFD